MKPWDLAQKMHADLDIDFNQAFGYYAHHGYIFSGPDYLIWGEEIQNSWLVYLAIGEGCIKKFIELQPYYLPTFGFCRMLKPNHQLRIYSMDRIARMFGVDIERIKNGTTTRSSNRCKIISGKTSSRTSTSGRYPT